jgi:hypothetical protein
MLLLFLDDKKAPVLKLLNRRGIVDADQWLKYWGLFVGHLAIVDLHGRAVTSNQGGAFCARCQPG